MKFKVFKPCSSSDIYDLVPVEDVKLDLDKLENKFKEMGFWIDLKNKYFLKGVREPVEITVYARGKFLVKNSGSKENAVELVNELIQ